MTSVCSGFATWLAHPLSAVVTFRKQFVDDVKDTVQRQKEKYNARTRELRQRAIQLHLDKLEENYLCCVCGRSGDTRVDDNAILSSVDGPTPPATSAVRETLSLKRNGHCDSATAATTIEATRENTNHHQDSYRVMPDAPTRPGREESDLCAYKQRPPLTRRESSPPPADLRSDLRRCSHDSVRVCRGTANSEGHVVGVRDTRSASTVRRSNETAAPDAPYSSTLLHPREMDSESIVDATRTHRVSQATRHGLMHAIRCAIRSNHALTHRRHVVVHRDKGLIKIEEIDIDMLSLLFQRQVRGYLCVYCYNSARVRLNTLTRQIQLILFKAQYPLLRRAPAHELRALLTPSASEGYLGRTDEEETTSIRGNSCRDCKDDDRAGIETECAGGTRTHDAPAAREHDASTHRRCSVSPNRHSRAHDARSEPEGECVAVAMDGADALHWGSSPTHTESHATIPDTHLSRRCRVQPISHPMSTYEQQKDRVSSGDGCTNAPQQPPRRRRSSRFYTQRLLARGHGRRVLDDDAVQSLRETVRCNVCRRRWCRFFVHRSVLFLCQFCCARDRFYRDNAVCLNDEPMPADCVHLLASMAKHYANARRQQELRRVPHVHVDSARVDLFGVVTEESLFSSLQPPSSWSCCAQQQILPQAGQHEEDVRERLGNTMVSMFHDTDLSPQALDAVDLFAAKRV